MSVHASPLVPSDPRLRPYAPALPSDSPIRKMLGSAMGNMVENLENPFRGYGIGDLLAAARSEDEAQNLTVLEGCITSTPQELYVSYLFWLASLGLVSVKDVHTQLRMPYVGQLTQPYSDLWMTSVETAVARLKAEGALLTPVTARLLAARTSLRHDLAAGEVSAELLFGNASPQLPLPPALAGVESGLITWIREQTSAVALEGLLARHSYDDRWAKDLVMRHSPLVATTEGMLSLSSFMTCQSLVCALDNPSLGSEGLSFLLTYASQGIYFVSDLGTRWAIADRQSVLFLLDALRVRGLTLTPEHLGQARIMLSGSRCSSFCRQTLAQVREICQDEYCRKRLWEDDAVRTSVLSSVGGPVWAECLSDVLVDHETSNMFPDLPSVVAATANWQLEGLDRATLARLMSCSSAELRAEILFLIGRLAAQSQRPPGAASAPAPSVRR